MGYLDPYVRRRIAAVLLVVGAVIAALALANVGPFSNPPSQEDRARAALQEFFDAAHRKDFAKVCALLTPSQVKSIESAGRQATGKKVACSDLVAAVGAGALAHTSLEVIDVRVSASLAAIDTKLRVEGRAGAELRTFKLEQYGDRWLISDLGI
jgi:ketosteroid isomerase-like protein